MTVPILHVSDSICGYSYADPVSIGQLHASGCFAIPNPWDIGTAIYLQELGFEALATTSSGFAWSQRRADGRISRDQVLAHSASLVEATNVPGSADFESGYAKNPADLFANVCLAVRTGIAGPSIEDSTGNVDGRCMTSPPRSIKSAATRC